MRKLIEGTADFRKNLWWFDVGSGIMYAYDRKRRAFELISRNG